MNNISHNLLCEFLTEELPPINLERDIGAVFANALYAELHNFIQSATTLEFFVTPRRFGCIIKNIAIISATQHLTKKGPAIAHGLEGNQPTAALLGFMRSCNIQDWQQLTQKTDGYFYAQQIIQGEALITILPQALNTAIKKMPIKKYMRWGSYNYSFVRPIHNFMLLLDNAVICAGTNILGMQPVNYTYGHRSCGSQPIVIDNPLTYTQQLLNTGKVRVNFAQRKQYILQHLIEQATNLNLQVNILPELLNEVTALVEYPVILHGEFNQDFLTLPQECLILSMTQHQKYFTLLNTQQQLSNKFLLVANIDSTNPQMIIQGNQKVLNARLIDAKFFYTTDLAQILSDWEQKLHNINYHNILGSQADRVIRLHNISLQIAQQFNNVFNNEIALISQTVKLLKVDLVSQMVTEFPELQGTMGKYYSLAKGIDPAIANAIEQHYYPRFSMDVLPQLLLGKLMALTDKLEIIVGMWGCGGAPTGDKDPWALRRHALGIIRLLLELPLPINKLLQITYATFNKFNWPESILDEIHAFIIERLVNYLIHVAGFSPTCVKSVIAKSAHLPFNHIPNLLQALTEFSTHEANSNLLAASKRIHNILKDHNFSQVILPQADKFTTNEEKVLWKLINTLSGTITQELQQQQWQQYFITLNLFNDAINNFFIHVMVMDNDPVIRLNRMLLLQQLYELLNQVCILAELE